MSGTHLWALCPKQTLGLYMKGVIDIGDRSPQALGNYSCRQFC
ncbi:hypothetical protein [Pseudanabaena sp. UWO310]|nr:hypothetical protein [Pseudanabaena sp. UWO310]